MLRLANFNVGWKSPNSPRCGARTIGLSDPTLLALPETGAYGWTLAVVTIALVWFTERAFEPRLLLLQQNAEYPTSDEQSGLVCST